MCKTPGLKKVGVTWSGNFSCLLKNVRSSQFNAEESRLADGLVWLRLLHLHQVKNIHVVMHSSTKYKCTHKPNMSMWETSVNGSDKQ